MTQSTPFSFVIFGATGDLTKRKLVPALYALYRMNMLPADFRIFAFARRPFTDASFVETLLPFIENGAEWEKFTQHIEYVQGDFSDATAYAQLHSRLAHYDTQVPSCSLRMYYMATSPDELPHIISRLGEARLHEGCGDQGKWTRIIIEKPFGRDLASARQLNESVKQYFSEEQIYRIDHYLGKETVQNILSVRFANVIMEPVWCRDYIEKIEINAYETLGVEERGGYYDVSGALRDMVQSHLLQIVALVTMNQPERYDAHEIRDKKNEILAALRPMTTERVAADTVRGQYAGYTQEVKVSPDSTTETFVAIRTYVDLPQWENVPIIIRTGKKLSQKRSEVIVTFKRSKGSVFSNLFCELRSNTLKIRLQPDEGVKMRMLIKQPGFKMQLDDVYLDYKYSDTYNNLPDAYERLLLDAISGDQSLFTRTDEIESSWKYITTILELWKEQNIPLHQYATHTEGIALPM